MRYRTVSLINTTGLAVGMASSILIYLWVTDEYKINRFHANGEHLYMVYSKVQFDGDIGVGNSTPALLATELKKRAPEIERASVLGTAPVNSVFQAGDKISKMVGSRAGVDFFSMFSYPLVQGNPATALANPTDIALSRKMAELFFGSPEAAIGKVIRYDNRKDLMVSSVFENMTTHSSEQYDFLLNGDAWVEENPENKDWNMNFSRTFIQIRPDADKKGVEEKIKNVLALYVNPPPGIQIELGLQLYGDTHLYTSFENGVPTGGRIDQVKIYIIVGIFLLLIACINFMNLSTARATKRAKEVGVRKVIGSTQWDLVKQFIGEAVLLTFIALLAAIALVVVFLPGFNSVTEKQLALPILDPAYWLMIAGMVVVTALLAGTYPAIYLSSLKPVNVLKGGLQHGQKGALFRKVLVVSQFVVSTSFIIGMIVISRQASYLQNTSVGYDREDMLLLPVEGELITKYTIFKQKAASLPGIKYIDRSSQQPHAMGFATADISWEGKDPATNVDVIPTSVGYDFIKLMGLKLTQGRDFSSQFTSDTSSFIVNELAAKRMGLKNPLGKQLSIYGTKGPIVGVIKDFHNESLHTPIRPLVLSVNEHLNVGTILVRTQPGKTQEALKGLEEVWKQLNPAYPFTFKVLEVAYQRYYRGEQTTARLTYAFALLAIVISCIGLLGLAMFSAEQRLKEIGIRKVLGATQSSIVTMFSIDFLKLAAIAFLIAAPLSGYMVNQWLQGYTYRISLDWLIFLLAGGLTLLITLLSVGLQAIRAANTNPIKTIKAE